MLDSKIWTPPRADKEPQFFCRVCRTSFITQKVFEQHVLNHGDDELEELRARHRAQHDQFYGWVDPEWETYNAALRRAGINPEVQYSQGRRSNIRRASES